MGKGLWSVVFRWLVFLPAGLLVGGVARALNTYGAHYMGLYEDSFLWGLFTAYNAVLESAVTVAAAALIAPAGRVIVASVVATLQSGMWIMLLFIELSINRILSSTERPGILWVVIGSVLGVVYVYQEEKKKSQEDEPGYSA